MVRRGELPHATIIAACPQRAAWAHDVLVNPWPRRPALAGLLAMLAVSLVIAACSGGGGAGHDHGRVAGHLTIPFHTLTARARGTTVMSWRYHAPGCVVAPAKATPLGLACPPVTLVTFTITIR